VLINEVDADQAGTDSAEFVELFDGGTGNTDLTGLVLVLFNGNGDTSYQAFDLDGFTTSGSGYFVLCGDAGNVANCDLDVSPDTNLVQNGADAVALFVGDAVNFPNGTPVTTTNLIDAIVYDTDDGDDAGLLVLLNAGQPQVNERGGGDGTGHSNQRCANGSGGARNTSTYTQAAPTPGATNACGTPEPADIIINEVDADQAGTDSAEFVELYDGGVGNSDLTGLVLVLFNGSDDASYLSFDLDGHSTDGSGYFVLCANAATVANCDLDVSPDTNLVQNGADAVALLTGDAADFPNDTAVTTTNLLDAIVYDTDDGDDAGLLVLLNAGQPQVNERDGGDGTGHSNQRCANGSGGARNTDTYAQFAPTPGAANICVPPVESPVMINEVDADQAGTDSAEFVELFDGGTGNTDLTGLVLVLFNGNGDTSYQAFDLDGFTTSGSGYFVLCGDAGNVANCDLDVSPNTNLVQNGADAVALYVDDASSFPNGTTVTTASLIDAIVYDTDDGDDAGLLVLLNAGQPQVNERGGGDGTGHSNQRCPNGSGGDRNTDTYAQFAPTPGAENICEIPVVGPFEIFEIQGSGPASPFASQKVLTENNIVTAVAPNGFFMQTPELRSDADVNTSDGIFVFTGGAPIYAPDDPVLVGDMIDVTGNVVEFFDFTEFTSDPVVTFKGPNFDLPTAVTFDASTPSPDPMSPSCAIEFECYEGMLVEIENGAVTGPNQRFNSDPIAEVHITAAPDRTFRETGIEYPGLPDLPVWDGNPEVFELDPDKLGLPNQIIPAGSSFSASGVLGFEFGGYEFWPTELTFSAAVLPQSVRARQRAEFTIGSLNMFRLFDDVDDPEDTSVPGRTRNDSVRPTAEYERRRAKFADYILNVLDAPDILAVQEAEKLEVLETLAADIAGIDSSVVYSAFLVEGNDIGTIDVGFLVRDTMAVDAITQLGKDEILEFDNSLLNDRPPLLLEGRLVNEGADYPVAVMVVHNRSLGGIDTSSGPRVRAKRLAQAQSIAAKVQAMQTDNPDVRLVIVGDFNAFEFTDGYVDVVGQIAGNFNPDDNLLFGDDLVDPDLINQVLSIPQDERYSFIFRGNAQVLDHALTSMALDASVRGFQYGRGNADAAVDLINVDDTVLRASDHDGLVLFLTKDLDSDGVNDDADVCPSTVIPETLSEGLGVNRFALTDAGFDFDTTPSSGKGPRRSYSTEDTAGCSCTQIVAAQGLGKGHTKFGCSIEVMDDWVQLMQ
jgi:predicted extracellular nuclease